MLNKLNMKNYSLILSLLLGLIFNPAAAQDANIDKAVKEHLAEIINIRHHLHQNPELGNREFKTAELVAEHLRKLGLEVRTGIAHTGVLGVLIGGKPGSVVAVRADMDALPVTEQTDLPYKSTVRTTYLGKDVGVMHACGHDIHTSALLGVASVMASIKDDIPGTIKFIFQPAEEGVPRGEQGGASMMVDEGVLDDPRPGAIFGLHTDPAFNVGQINYAVGPAMAAVDRFSITIKGKQAHGAAPENSIDPIVTASHAVVALQTIRSRNLDPLQPSVVTVGVFRGGERFNIIPEEVLLEGTVRTYDPVIRKTIERRINEIMDGITRSAGATYEISYSGGGSSVFNNIELVNNTLPIMREILGEVNVIETPPQMTGEDFSVYANMIPGFFFWLGVNNPEFPSGALHNPTYRADDSSVEAGMRLMSNILLDYLRSNKN
ncbi:M20 family metallopeptidase [candidate division KSB1 bacterium]